ncbi:MAG: quinolinate synthase NadA [Proteobacteria bacterium]|nr:quinolinate synthase NadA [Pseudomonadota bacterium]
MDEISSIPDSYRGMDADELRARIRAHKERLGAKLVILGHFYQRDEVIEFSDFQGDSFELAKHGAQAAAEHIVFCGVRFMAEAASILAKPGQRVYLPAMDAGCALADMADVGQATAAWQALERQGVAKEFLPVVYINSSAAIKAFCGERGGTVCTSSSAGRAFDWATGQGRRVFFMPDRNLGINTALANGFKENEIAVWDPYAPNPAAAKGARVIVWKGHCHVHTFFTEGQVEKMRAKYQGCTVAVHPESDPEVVAASDAAGSTSFLKRYAEDAPAGSTVVIGTEINFVNRLARKNADRRIVPLARSLCPSMFRTSMADLLWVLDELGRVNEIRVADELARGARLALDRMLRL